MPVGYIDCGTFDRWTTWDGNQVLEVVDVPSGGLALTVRGLPGGGRFTHQDTEPDFEGMVNFVRMR